MDKKGIRNSKQFKDYSHEITCTVDTGIFSKLLGVMCQYATDAPEELLAIHEAVIYGYTLAYLTLINPESLPPKDTKLAKDIFVTLVAHEKAANTMHKIGAKTLD